MEYFEELADLLEEEREKDFDEIFAAIGDTPAEIMGEILENYIEDFQNSIPDSEQDLYMLVENIKTGMLFLCENLEDENTKAQFAEELTRFKNWYTKKDTCIIDGIPGSVMEAVASARADKITGANTKLDFDGALDYELRDFEMTIGNFNKIDVVDDKTIIDKTKTVH